MKKDMLKQEKNLDEHSHEKNTHQYTISSVCKSFHEKDREIQVALQIQNAPSNMQEAALLLFL